MKKILVTGAIGQIGSDLVSALKEKYGQENVVASDIRQPDNVGDFLPFEILDVLNVDQIEEIVKKHQIDTIFHLAALLSATGEKNPQACWKVNMDGLFNILEIGRKFNLKKIICPSSIAAFGPTTPRDNTPQATILEPATMYGVTKVAGELLCEYYVSKYGLDVRGIRYPGLISYKALPGGGTTDFAVDIFYKAIEHKKYQCFVGPDTTLPMMYMDDAIEGTIRLAQADFDSLKHHCNFNFAGMSFSAADLAKEIKKHIADFEITYDPDFRQAIADTWPRSIDDTAAREEWGWKPKYDLSKMVEVMLTKVAEKLGRQDLKIKIG